MIWSSYSFICWLGPCTNIGGDSEEIGRTLDCMNALMVVLDVSHTESAQDTKKQKSGEILRGRNSGPVPLQCLVIPSMIHWSFLIISKTSSNVKNGRETLMGLHVDIGRLLARRLLPPLVRAII